MCPLYKVFRKCFTSGITVRLLYTSCRALGQHLTLQATFRLWYKTTDKGRSQAGELKVGDSALCVQGTQLMELSLTAEDRAEHLPPVKVGTEPRSGGGALRKTGGPRHRLPSVLPVEGRDGPGRSSWHGVWGKWETGGGFGTCSDSTGKQRKCFQAPCFPRSRTLAPSSSRAAKQAREVQGARSGLG